MRLCVHTRLKGRVGVEGSGENGQEESKWKEERVRGGEALERRNREACQPVLGPESLR